jgi:hypothetical protein
LEGECVVDAPVSWVDPDEEKLIELAELMGHSNLSQVRKYALSDAERVRVGVAKRSSSR